MLWTQEQQAAARAECWELVDTVEFNGGHPVLRIFGYAGRSNQEAQGHVLTSARQGSGLHIEALRAISLSALIQGTRK